MMTIERKEKTNKPPLECMVCGKLFPRGALDLARHQSALTLLHRVGDKKTATFQFGCQHCGYYFTTEEHLNLHSYQSSCGKKRIGFIVPQDECLVCSAPLITDGIKHEIYFPKHIYSASKRLNAQHVCNKCGLYFISEDVVAEHSRNSFCSRFGAQQAEKERQREREREKEIGKEDYDLHYYDDREYLSNNQHSSTIKNINNNLPLSSTSLLSTTTTTTTTSIIPTSTTSTSKRSRQSKDEKDINDIFSSPHSHYSSPSINSLDFQHSNSSNSSLRRTKRTKQLIPADRKALYSLCSLFIDKSKLINPSDAITVDNILNVIEDEKLSLVRRLMDVLHYDC